MVIAELARRVSHARPARPRAEHIRELPNSGQDVHETESGYGAAHEVVREQGSEQGQGFAEVVPIPEGRPGNQDEQQSGFEEQGDKKETSEQGGLLFGLELGQSQDLVRDIAVVAGFGFELDEHRESARQFAGLFEGIGQVVHQSAAGGC